MKGKKENDDRERLEKILLVGDHQPDTFGAFFHTDFLIFNIETKQFDTVQLGY
jgi:hypothetical protein